MKIWYKDRHNNVAAYIDSNSPVFGYLISKIDATYQNRHIIKNDHIEELIKYLDMFIVIGADLITPRHESREDILVYSKLTLDEAHEYRKQFLRLAPFCRFISYFKVDDLS